MSRNPIYIKLINTAKWRRLRLHKLNQSPLCEECRRNGKTKLAEEVHHIIPVESVSTERQMNSLMYNHQNLMSLCHECHVAIHTSAFSHSKESIKKNNERHTERFVSEFLKKPKD